MGLNLPDLTLTAQVMGLTMMLGVDVPRRLTPNKYTQNTVPSTSSPPRTLQAAPTPPFARNLGGWPTQ